jgi:hypothetical protein
MIKKFIFASVLLLLCSSCVSRTIVKEPGLKGAGSAASKGETKIIWFWDKDF